MKIIIEKPIIPHLLGSGIVCGLTVVRHDDQNIAVEKGYGYGSSGMALTFDNNTLFRHYKQLDLTRESELKWYFVNEQGVPEHDFRLWELLTDEKSHRAEPKAHEVIRLLKPQNALDTEGGIFLDDKVAVLYRDSEREPIRVLLMLKKHAAVLAFPKDFQWQNIVQTNNSSSPFSIWGDTVVNDPSREVSDHDIQLHLHKGLHLPVLAIRRFGYGDLKLEDFACDDVYEPLFCNELQSFEQINQEYTTIIDALRPEMESALAHLHTHFGELIGHYAVKILNDFWITLEKRWCAFKEIPLATDKTAVQYWYDLFADLVTAYNELRAVALSIKPQCRHSPSAYSRYLLLGSLPAEPTFAFLNPFRTHYQQPPIYNLQAEQVQRLRFLHGRLVLMMKCFFAPNTDWDDLAFDSLLMPNASINNDNPADIAEKIALPIRLTPSRPLSMPLGQRAIPFYFDLVKNEHSLHWYWDFEATQQNRATEHLSYHSENEAAFVKQKDGDYYAGTEGGSYTHVPHVIHPFAFDLRSYPFVRIEGHIGKTANTTEFKVFKVKNALGGETTITIKDFLAALAKHYTICFNVELKATSELKDFCGSCIDHLGGVYHGGTFVIVYEDITPRTSPSTNERIYKIVADFTYLKGCHCPTSGSDATKPIQNRPVESVKTDPKLIITEKEIKPTKKKTNK